MPDYIEVVLRAAVGVLAVIALVRLTGLRAFSKMSSFDFALTIATGSVLASLILGTGTNLAVQLIALAAIFGVQALIALVRARTSAQEAIDNSPLLLMRHGEMFDENLAAARVTRSDVLAKLREANALDFARVQAVVMETTGDISVLHGEADEATLAALLKPVRGV